MSNYTNIFDIQNWLSLWGIVILLGLPILFVIATIVYRKRLPSGRGLIPPQIIRFLFIPFCAVHLILTKIINISSETFIIKTSTTVIAIILISFFFNAINYLLFSENNILRKKEIIPKLGRNVLHIILITIITACVLSIVWDLNLGNLLTALGVGSVVIGLALQEPLGNLFTGISLLMANPFKKGEWIKVGDEIGKVSEINWRSVKIHTKFNEQIIIPNNILGKEKIKNLSRPDRIYAEVLEFGFSYNDRPSLVKKVLLAIVKDNDKILKNPSPVALTLSYDDFAIIYGLKIFVRDYEDFILLKDEIMTEVFEAAVDNNISIPFPRQQIEIIKPT